MAKLEKQARRAKEKAEREQGGGSPAAATSGAAGAAAGVLLAKKGGASGASGGKDGSGGQKQLPIRHGGAGGSVHQQPQATIPGGGVAGAAGGEGKEQRLNKNVAVFGHLYGQQRRTSIAGVGKEVHPAVLALGLQMRDYVVCGSSARCLAMLLVFKRVRPAFC